jgi:hypothetical protein
MRSEPTLRINLGGRWSRPEGPFVDVALHYVSAYKMPLIFPEEPFEDPELESTGNNLLAIGRLGYRLPISGGRAAEAGLTVRAPIGAPFKEFPGNPIKRSSYSVTVSHFAGEMIVRLVALYLRGSF